MHLVSWTHTDDMTKTFPRMRLKEKGNDGTDTGEQAGGVEGRGSTLVWDNGGAGRHAWVGVRAGAHWGVWLGAGVWGDGVGRLVWHGGARWFDWGAAHWGRWVAGGLDWGSGGRPGGVGRGRPRGALSWLAVRRSSWGGPGAGLSRLAVGWGSWGRPAGRVLWGLPRRGLSWLGVLWSLGGWGPGWLGLLGAGGALWGVGRSRAAATTATTAPAAAAPATTETEKKPAATPAATTAA